MSFDIITLSDVEKIAGIGKKQGREWVFRCPICASLGNDKTGDNLKFNEDKNLLYCFANDYHSKDLCSMIQKSKRPEPIAEIPQWQTDQDLYMRYMLSCNHALLGYWGLVEEELFDCDIKKFMGIENKVLNYLYEVRGIKPSTVELTGLGIDFEKGRWVIPIFNNDKIKGFRYRGKDFSKKKVWSEIDTPSCIAWVYGCEKAEKLYICEGEFDAIIMTQMCLEHDIQDFTVCTPSTGVASLPKCINQIKFNNFKEIYLCLDNDEAGEKITKELLNKYPFIKDDRNSLKIFNVKDINEFYLKVKLQK